MEVPPGKVFGFLGPNGSGKTTTIRLLLGLLRPTAGHAEVLGHDIRTSGEAIRRSTGTLLEHSGLYERLTAERNLELHARIWRLSPSECRRRIREVLGHLGLYDRRQEFVGTWSRGMKQKLGVARAILHRPALLILDEPTAGLDPEASVSLREDIRRLAAHGGTTIFLTTHNLAEAEKVCDVVGLIRNGKLVALGAPDSLCVLGRPPVLQFTGRGFTEKDLERLRARTDVAGACIGDRSMIVELREDADRAGIVRTVVEGGGEVEEVRQEDRSLEDVYLEIMGSER
jgi:ABC-2 type transport system ATP-binding protein